MMRALLVTLVLLLSSCSSSSPAPPVHWEAVDLPHPAGTRLVLKDATDCDGTFLVAGAVESGGVTRPGAWYGASRIATSGGDLYAHHAIVMSSACRNGTVVLIGTKSGGAHGMPRTSTYVGTTAAVRDVRAPYVLFGGTEQLSVRHFAVGPDGFRLTGSRAAGAAVWTSPNGRHFTARDHEPGLASGPGEQTAGLDSIYFEGRWLVTGSIDGRAAVWEQSASGWERTYLTSPGRYAVAEHVVATDSGLLALGLDGRRFTAWTSTDGTTWRTAAHLGALPSGVTGAPFVSGLAAVPDGAVASISDGVTYRLFRLTTSWRPLVPPVRLPPTTGDHAVTLAAIGPRVLLIVDDGTSSRVWETSLSRP